MNPREFQNRLALIIAIATITGSMIGWSYAGLIKDGIKLYNNFTEKVTF